MLPIAVDLANGLGGDRACSVISLWIAIAIGFSSGVWDIFMFLGGGRGLSMYRALALPASSIFRKVIQHHSE